MEIQYGNTIPNADEYYLLYETTGWNSNNTYSKEKLFKAINNSWFVVSAYHKEKLVGFGRMISDGFYQTFIVDMIVHPHYQNRGIGKNIMNLLFNECKSNDIKWVQLSCAKGKQNFYKKFGFQERPIYASGMQKFL